MQPQTHGELQGGGREEEKGENRKRSFPPLEVQRHDASAELRHKRFETISIYFELLKVYFILTNIILFILKIQFLKL